ncbi:hypothetical protein MBAV_004013 [Candidatus Magnetobacterium bavaricum]|uniref:Uncharacterized protein n=1 Tax=Candidatus Magnetobacterium bavaricum TaxID=29290 RepID=A0A0F3GPJ3_9BACT|nr:hypothetical protein MBAV_004013 [Candidatus Magnetobacterium bavaricum]
MRVQEGLVQFCYLRAYGKYPAVGHGVPGVCGKVHKNLCQLIGIGHDDQLLRKESCNKLHVLTYQPGEHLLRGPDHVVNVHGFGLHLLLAAKGQQALDQLDGPLGRCQYLVGICPRGVSLLELQLKDVAIADNGREYVVEVMGNTAGQLPDGLHLL